MKKREILIIICIIICCIFSLQAVSAASDGLNTTHGANLNSNVSAYSLPNSNNQLQAGSVNAGTFSNLQNNISGGGSITLVNNYTYDSSSDSGLAGGITITKDTIIDGQGKVIIDANNQARVFKVASGATLTLTGITFINANPSSGHGGSILATGTVHIDNCKFINNTANFANGGAVCLVGLGSTINNSYFEGNKAINNGNDNNGAAGAVFINANNTIIENTIFIKNMAGLNGGAIGSSPNHIEKCTIINCTLTNNTANGSAGGIGMQSSNFHIYNSTFRYNEAKGLFDDITTKPYYPGNGGGMVMRGWDSYAYNCTFIGNIAKQHGGGVYSTNTSYNALNNNTGFELCTFINNTAGSNGGAVDWTAGATHGYIYDSTFTNNTAKRSGGAIHWSGHYGSISNSTFTNNNATGEVMTIIGGILGGGDGGAVVWIGSHGIINDSCIFIGNEAKYRGGAIFLHGNATENCTNITVDTCTFEDNIAGTNGGAVDWHEGSHDGEIKYSTFNNNIAKANGGAVYWRGHEGKITYSNFTGNTAKGLLQGLYNNTGDGGAIFWAGVNGSVDHARFINNKAIKNVNNDTSGRGGAMYIGSCEHGNRNITITNSYFEDNNAGTNGGAIDWYAGAHDGLVSDSLFVNNIANRSGGAIFWNGHNGTIRNSNFTYNQALGITAAKSVLGPVTFGGDGGAVMWSGALGTVDNVSFIGNNAHKNADADFGGRGGAVFLQAAANETCENTKFTNVYFEDNVAGTNGGAIDWNKGAQDGLVENATFVNNIANRSGGAIFWNGHNGTIRNANFTNNSALGITNATSVLGPVTFGGDGGAVMWSGAIGTVDNCNFINNTAAKRGGAVFLQAAANETCDNTTFKNSYFENNVAGTNGGAIDWNDGAHNGIVENVIFISNTAKRDGGAIFWHGQNGTIKNSKFRNNRATGETLEYNMTLTMEDVIVVNDDKLPTISESDIGRLYVLNYTNGSVRVFKSYVADNSTGVLTWLKLDETTTLSATISPTDWAIDQFFGGDGGTILWSGNVGIIENCTIIGSDSARRGGGAYMTGSSNVTFANCYFENSTSGTNGGGVDWLAGARYGKIINCTFNETRAARSAGAIYYDGWYGEMTNITIINTKAWGGSLKESEDGLVKYAGWDSSHWDTNTTGGDGGAIMITGSNEYLYNITFINCTATGRGGAVFLQDNTNVTFDLCIFKNNQALGIANNTWNDDKDVTSGLNILHTGNGGAIGFDVGATDGYIYNSKFINNTAARNGGALSFYTGSSGGHIYNSTFVDNTAKRSGGAFFWDGTNGTVSYCNFTGNKALGTALEYDMVLTYGNIVVVNSILPEASASTMNKLYILDNTTDENHINYISYVTETDGENYTWLLLDETHIVNDTAPSPTDWAMDQFLGGNGGTILWGGNNGIIDHCIIEDSNSARRGGGAYMRGSDNITFSNCNFTNDTSGTNGGALDWLAGANHGRVINCTFEDNQAARSAGTLYYDGNYGQFINITIKNSYAHGGDLKTSPDGSVHYAGWDSSHWDTNTTGGDAGAIMITGDHVYIYNATFINNTAVGRGGAVFLQDNNNVTFDLCIFENNEALGTANNTYNNPRDVSSKLNVWKTGLGGAIGFDLGASNGTIMNSKFINNTAARDGGAISFAYGSSNATIYNSLFENNTAKRNGGAFAWNGNNGNISYCNFTSNAALGVALDTDHVNLTSLSQVINLDRLPKATEETTNKLYVLVTLDDNDEKVSYALYVTVPNGHGGYEWLLHVESNETDPSPTDWGIDEYFGGDGGSILWGGDNGIIDNCIFIDSNSARRGGSAYMLGSDHVTVSNSYFENCTSGTNGGGLDWLAGANYGKVINCTFNNTRAARSAGAIYYDGDYGEMTNITIINATAFGGALKESKDGKVKYAGWDSSHWDTNTTGGDAGAIMFTGDYVYVYNVTFENCTAAGRGGAVFLQDNHDVTFELCTFEENSALGTANNTWNNYKEERNDANPNTAVNSRLTGHGGAIAFDVGASEGTILNCTFNANHAARDGGAVYYATGATKGYIINSTFTNHTINYDGGAIYLDGSYCEIHNSTFINNTAKDDGGAIFWQGNHGLIYNITCDTNNGTGTGINDTSSTKGGVICLTGSDVLVTKSSFTNSYGGLLGGTIFVTGNGVNITDSVFKNSTIGYEDGGALYILGNNTLVRNCTFDNCTSPRDGGSIYVLGNDFVLDNSIITNSTAVYGGAIYVSGDGAMIGGSQVSNTTAVNGGAIYVSGDGAMIGGSQISDTAAVDGGAIYVSGDGAVINGSQINNITAYRGGGMYIAGNNFIINSTSFTDINATEDGGGIYITGNGGKLYNSIFINNTVGDDGGAIHWRGDYGTIYNITSIRNNGTGTGVNNTSSTKGGAVIITGNHISLSESSFTESYAGLLGGTIFITGNDVNITDSTFKNSTVGMEDGGTIYILGNETNILNCTIEDSSARYGGAIFVEGDNATVSVNFKNTNATLSGGSIYVDGINATISNSTFDSTYAFGSVNNGGGAIFINGNFSTVEESKFNNNHADNNHEARGGAIYVTGLNTTINSSEFEHSRSNLYGGAIYINGNHTCVIGSNFTDCSVNSPNSEGGAIYVFGENAVIDGSSFVDSSAKLHGGAIYINGDNTTVNGSSFTRSTVEDASSEGGAIYVFGDNATIDGSTFVDSSAKLYGGAMYIEGDYATIKDSNFNHSTVTAEKSRGGAIYLEGSYCNVDGSLFIDSSAKTFGGAMYSTGSYSTVYKSNFTNNIAEYDGGGIYWYGGTNSKYNTVDGCIFTGNIAYAKGKVVRDPPAGTDPRTTLGGGAVYWSEKGSYGTVKNSEFYNNSVQSEQKADGGAILWDNCFHALIDNCKFVGNFINTTATGKMVNNSEVWVQGGAIYARSNGNYTIRNSVFENCTSSKEAGALYIQTGTSYNTKYGLSFKVENTEFKNNVAECTGPNCFGGGAVQVKQYKYVEFRNVTFTNNTAEKLSGGALMTLHTGQDFNMYDCKFIDNKADQNGGALSVEKALKMYDTSFYNNTAGEYGGALYTTLGITNNNLNFTYNKAERGSAIYSTSDLTLNNAALLKNRANSDYPSFIVTKNKTSGNITIDFKGWDNYLNGIYMEANKALTVKNVTYWNESEVVNTGSTSRTISPKHPAAATLESGQNFTIELGNDEGIQFNKGKDTFLTDANGHISVNMRDLLPEGVTFNQVAYIDIYLTNEDYYTYVENFTRTYPDFNASTTNATFHLNGTVSVDLPVGAKSNVSVYIYDQFMGNITLDGQGDGTIEVSTLVNGQYLEVGSHPVVLKYAGDGRFRPTETTTVLNVTKADSRILFNITPYYYDFIINVTVEHNETGIVTNPNDVTGNVTLNVRGQIINIQLVNGTGSAMAYNMPPGAIKIEANYSGDDNYKASSNFTYANITERIRTLVDINILTGDIFVDETIYIEVTVISNQTVEGNITIILDNKEYNVTLNNSKAIFNKTGLPAGEKIVTAIFAGNETLAPSSDYAHFNVFKYDAFVLINTTNITHESDEVINISVPQDAVGIVNVTINGVEFKYKHILEIINGTVTIPLHDLDVDVYNITVLFEDAKYKFTSNSSLFKVSKLKPPIVIKADNVTYGNDTVIFVEVVGAAGGNITLKINDTLKVFENVTLINDAATFAIKLPAGNYIIDVTYSGDESDLANSAKSNFTVFKANPAIDISVYDIYFGSREDMVIGVNVAGNVTIKLDGTIIAENVPLDDNNQTSKRLTDLMVGKHVVEVIFSGNDNFNSASETAEFYVNPVITKLTIEADDIFVWDKTDINITVLDYEGYLIRKAPGNIVININGVNYTAGIVDGIASFNIPNLDVGHKVVWAFYDGDGDLDPSKASGSFEVKQRTPNVSVTVDDFTVSDDGKLIINVPANATGYVVVSGNFTNYQFRVDNFNQGVAEINIGKLAIGNYTVHIKYYGEANDNYTIAENDCNFTVYGANTTVDVDVKDIVYGQNANITVTVPDGVTGTITLKLNDTANSNITLPIYNGKVNWIVEDLAAGNYTVNVTYNGNDKYNANSTNKTFKVIKAVPVISIDDIVAVNAATNATIIVRVNETATGNITITVNNTKYNATIKNGVATFTIDKLLANSYVVTAEYAGDANYTAASAVTKVLVVSKVDCYQINVTANDTKVDLNTTIVVRVPADATGNVSIYIDGKFAGNATISNGIAELNKTMPYGNHTVNVTFSDGKYGFRYATTDYWVFKYDSPLDIKVDSILVGDVAYINVTAPSDNVTIEINGKSYNKVKYENGIAYFEVADLEAGNKTVVAIYGGSNKYVQNTTTDNFTVTKRATELGITVTSPVDVGENATINVVLPADAKGYVVVNVGGTNYTINLTAGHRSLEISGLKNDTYNVIATYLGDDKYLSSINNTKLIKVNKVPSSINLTVSEDGIIAHGNNVNITIEVPVDATGKVNVTLYEGVEIIKSYIVYVNEGKGILHLDTPDIGLYKVVGKYLGDDKYTGNDNETSFEVYATGKELTVLAENVYVNESNNITVTIAGRYDGEITIVVSNASGEIFKQNVTITPGNVLSTANVTLPLLEAGKYDVWAVYVEVNGTKTIVHEGNDSFNVDKLNSHILIESINATILVGENETIKLNITLDPRANDGSISVFVNGVEYNTTTSNLILEITDLNAGDYDVEVIFHGNEWYLESNTTGSFKVVKNVLPMDIKVTNSSVGSIEQINVTLPSDATGQILLDIDGQHYYANITDGLAQFNITGLKAGEHEFNVTYLGNNKYLENNTNSTLKVSKVQPAFVVNGNDIVLGAGELITFETSENITGLVKVEIDNENYTAFINEGKGNLTVYNLAAGKHNVTVYFQGNEKYLNASAKNNFTVSKATPEIELSVVNITYTENETVIVYVDAIGNVTLRIGSYVNTTDLTNGKAVFIVKGLAAGNYTANATFNGNVNLTKASTEANFTVAKATPVVTVTVNNITYYSIEDILVNVNTNGNVTIKVNGTIKGKELVLENGAVGLNVNDLAAGTYPVEVIYNGNNNYTSAGVDTFFVVYQAPVSVDVEVGDITVGGSEIINVTISNVNATGDVIINVDGVNYTGPIVDGKANLTLGKLTNGTHSVVVIYMGDGNLTGNWSSKTFNVDKLASDLTINVSNINVNQKEIIKVNVTAGATGTVVITVDGINHHVEIENGFATLELSDLANKTYNVHAKYLGDANYTGCEGDASFNVSKVPSNIIVKVENITIGDVAVVNITVIVNATGNVTITIGDEYEQTVGLIDGIISVIVPDLSVGNKTVNVTYNGDGKFLTSTNSTNFTVGKATTDIILVVENITYTDNETVTVYVDAIGNVTLNIGSYINTTNITNGKAVFIVKGLAAGNYTAIATYNGNVNLTSVSTEANFTVAKATPDLNVIVENITYYSIENILVNVNTNGNVTIKVNGTIKGKELDLNNGPVELKLTDLAAGIYPVEVTFNGNENYTSATVNTVFVVNKASVTVDVDVEDIAVTGKEIINVTISSVNATGDVIINVDGVNYTKHIADGKANLTLDKLTNGTHSVVVIYMGDRNLTGNWTSKTFEVDKLASDLTINVTDINVGQKEIIKVNVTAGATGTVVITVDGKDYSVGIENGFAILELNNLANGTYTVHAKYLGNANYTGCEGDASFNVSKVPSTINLTVSHYGVIANGSDVNITIQVPADATGKVNVTISDGIQNKTYIVYVNDGIGILHLETPSVGVYNVTARYLGDNKYIGSENQTEFEVYNTGKELTVDTENIYVGLDEIILIYVTGNHIGKEVEIIVKDSQGKIITQENSTFSTYIPNLNGTSARLVLKNLDAGEYTVDAIYIEVNGTKIIEHNGNGSFEVMKLPSELTIKEIRNITVGENVTIELELTPNAATGNISVFVNGIEHKTNTSNLIITVPSLGAEEYYVHAFYYGDNNYLGSNATAEFKVSKNPVPISVNVTNSKVGEVEQINVTLLDDATGRILLEIGDNHYYANISNGTATFNIDKLDAGEYNFTVIYEGDDKYFANQSNSSFIVSKYQPEFTINGDNIIFGGEELIKFETDDNITSVVKVEINDKNYTAFISEGKGNLTVYNLAPGDYNITLYFEGNYKFLNATAKNNFTVSKAASEIELRVENITYTESETVIVYVDATGNVTLRIADIGYINTVNITDGKAVFIIDDLNAGNYTVEATFNGNDELNASSISANFTVFKADPIITLEVHNIVYGDVEHIIVRVNAEGNVTIRVNGTTETIVLRTDDSGYVILRAGPNTISAFDGKAHEYIYNLKPGEYPVDVTYNGNANYNAASVSDVFYVSKANSSIKVDVDDITVEDVALINVTLPENATGNITIEINGKEYKPESFVDGVARFKVENLTHGDKTVAVTYRGDDNYSSSFATANFTVSKVTPQITINVTDINAGDKVLIEVTAPSDVENPVLVDVDGVGYYVNITGGKGELYVSNLTSGNYNVTAKYPADEKYTESSNATSFNVSKVPSSVNVTADDITVGENAVINIETPSDFSGNVTVSVDGNIHTVPIYGGRGTLVVDNLDVGPHTVDVFFNGSDKYEASNNSTVFNVNKTVLTGDEIKVIDQGNGTITVVVPNDATGDITINVGNNTYNAPIKDGIATIDLDNETPGQKEIEVIYSGDDKHTNATTNANVTIPKAETPISISVDDILVGDKVLINVTLPDDATGSVTIEINGKNYTAPVVNGTASFEVDNLTYGNKTIVARYDGDDNYLTNVTTGQFSVSKRPAPIDVEIFDADVGENVTVIVTLPDDATGQVLIDIDGVGYYVNLTNGIGVASIPRIPSGVYPVNITYVGDEKYLPNSTKGDVNVTKLKSFVIPNAQDILVGDDEKVTFTVPSDATGKLLVDEFSIISVDDGNKYVVDITEGTGELTVSGLPKGKYIVSVRYDGDEKYLPSDNKTTFRVSERDLDMDIVDYKNKTVVVSVPENATGNITIVIENQTYVSEIINGTAVFYLENATPGIHDIEVSYSGDDQYRSKTVNSTAEIPKYETPTDVSSQNIHVGENETITVSLPKDATGTVTIEIDGSTYSANVTDGKAVFNIPGLTAGNKTVTVKYSGDNNYMANSTTANFTVSKNISPISATGDPIKEGEDATIVVNLPSDATGTVTITVDGKSYTAEVVDGKAVFIIPGLTHGDYLVHIYYSGDDKYEANETSIQITVDSSSNPGDNTPSRAKGINLSKYPTGNPIWVLLLIILLIGSTQIRRFKK